MRALLIVEIDLAFCGVVFLRLGLLFSEWTNDKCALHDILPIRLPALWPEICRGSRRWNALVSYRINFVPQGLCA